jgi:chromosome segregation ATPase
MLWMSLSKAEDHNRKQAEEIRRLEERVSEQLHESKESLSKMHDLEARLADKSMSYDRVSQSHRDLETDVSEAKLRLTDALNGRAALQTEIDRLNIELTQARNLHGSAVSAMKVKEAEVASLKNQIDIHLIRVSEFEKQIGQHMGRISFLEGELSKTSETSRGVTIEANKNTERLISMSVELAAQRERTAHFENLYKVHFTRATELENAALEQRQNAEKLQKDLEDNATRTAQLQDLVRVHSERADNFEKQAIENAGKAANLAQSSSSTRLQITQLEKDITSKLDTIGALNAEIDGLKKRLAESESRYLLVNETHINVVSNLERSIKENELSASQLKADLADKSALLVGLQNQIAQLTVSLDHEKLSAARLRQERDGHRDQAQKFSTELDQLAKLHDSCKGQVIELESLRNQLEDAKRRGEDAEVVKRDLVITQSRIEEISVLQRELDDAKRRLQDLVIVKQELALAQNRLSEMEVLRIRNQELQDQLAAFDRVQAENEKLRNRCSALEPVEQEYECSKLRTSKLESDLAAVEAALSEARKLNDVKFANPPMMTREVTTTETAYLDALESQLENRSIDERPDVPAKDEWVAYYRQYTAQLTYERDALRREVEALRAQLMMRREQKVVVERTINNQNSRESLRSGPRPVDQILSQLFAQDSDESFFKRRRGQSKSSSKPATNDTASSVASSATPVPASVFTHRASDSKLIPSMLRTGSRSALMPGAQELEMKTRKIEELELQLHSLSSDSTRTVRELEFKIASLEAEVARLRNMASIANSSPPHTPPHSPAVDRRGLHVSIPGRFQGEFAAPHDSMSVTTSATVNSQSFNAINNNYNPSGYTYLPPGSRGFNRQQSAEADLGKRSVGTSPVSRSVGTGPARAFTTHPPTTTVSGVTSTFSTSSSTAQHPRTYSENQDSSVEGAGDEFFLPSVVYDDKGTGTCREGDGMNNMKQVSIMSSREYIETLRRQVVELEVMLSQCRRRILDLQNKVQALEVANGNSQAELMEAKRQLDIAIDARQQAEERLSSLKKKKWKWPKRGH